MYNGGKYIEEALQSIISQTYINIEIIVVNDGSTDSGPGIVERMISVDSRIKMFHQSNKGQCAASNEGFRRSSGSYIKFFDADDILAPGTIASQVKVLEKATDMDGSYIDYIRFFDDDLNTTDRYILPALINYDCSPIEYIKFHGSPQMFNNALWLFKRELFEKTGLWDERLSVNNDGEFFPRILQFVNRLYYAPEGKLFYRTNFNSGSLSQQTSLKGIQSALLSVDLMAGYVRTMEQSEVIEKIIAQSYSRVLGASYPAHPAITKLVEKKLAAYDRSYYKTSTAGTYGLFEKLLGWKLAKRIQLAYYKLRY
jgi:glycosyltransferase involved in cell wall biosynthesis